MNSELMQLLFSTKLKVTDEIIGLLPSPVRGKVREVRKSLIEAVHDATGEYLKNNAHSEKTDTTKSRVTSIPID